MEGINIREPERLEPVIKLENLGKRFEVVSEAPRSLLELLISFVPRSRPQRRHRGKAGMWAVQDVTLDIAPGQCVGLIGKNGSGKSTLLKLIARILRPTTGRITVRGRVSALLELGTGFHHDLTGRENIYLNASVLGLSREETNAHFDSVVAFSELEEFIDTPVKYYSSGMFMRLGFSIAVHVNPRLLIIDEILAVGDQAFQEKCIKHIHELKQKGTTIVLVSHNLDVMRKLCTHLVWMEKGQVRAQGTAEEMIQEYLRFLFERGHQPGPRSERAFKRLGTGSVEITDVRLLNGKGEEEEVFMTGDAMTIEMSFVAHERATNPEFGLAIFRQDGVQVSGPNSSLSGFTVGQIEGHGVVRYCIRELPLLPANYVISVAVHNAYYGITYDHHDRAYEFQIGTGGTRELFGLVQLAAEWEWEPQPSLVREQT